MKKRILFTLLMLGLISVSSLKAQFSIGPGVLYATDINTFGVSANVNYDFTEIWGAMASYTYFFSKDVSESTGFETASYKPSWWALDVDGTYAFTRNDMGKFYALAGFNIMYWHYPNSGITAGWPSDSHSGLNIGAGWKHKLGQKMDLVPEVRYTFAEGGGYLRACVKLMFSLSKGK